jgi:hypothetical protein
MALGMRTQTHEEFLPYVVGMVSILPQFLRKVRNIRLFKEEIKYPPRN